MLQKQGFFSTLFLYRTQVKTIVLIGVLLAICLFSFGIYMQDLLILSVGLLVVLFSIVFALETQHILHNPFRK